MSTIEFFFDYSSPWTFLAFDRIERIAREMDARLVWKPFLVGGVFNAINPSVYQRRENPVPPKDEYYRKDMNDWAKLQGIHIGKPPVFPVNSVKALRGAFLAEELGQISPYSRAVFEAYWRDLRDISQDDVLLDLIGKIGVDREHFLAFIASQTAKDRLRANTDELIRRGGFGSPTMFVDGDDMYFGNDRLELMQALTHRRKAAGR